MPSYKVYGKPWAPKIGAKNVENCTTAAEVMHESGLDFTVEKCPLVAKMPFRLTKADEILDQVNEGECFIHGDNVFRDCDGSYATFRTDLNIPLGVVKSKYEVVQNVDAFSFFDDAIGKDRAIWQTAGCFGSGERIFVSAKLPDDIIVNGDPVENYLVFTSTHDGSSGVTILFTPIRVVCQNTLNAALKTTDCFITFRHTKSVHDNINRATELLHIARRQTEDTSMLFNHLATTKMDDAMVARYLAELHLTTEEYQNVVQFDPNNGFKKVAYRDYHTLEVTGISMRKANIIGSTYEYYFDGIGQRDIIGTAYGAYNAVTGYYSNIANLEGTRRMDSLLYGNASRMNNKALNLAMAI